MSYHNPDQYTEQQSGLEPPSLDNRVAEWIDTMVIAQCIREELESQEVEVTEDNVKEVYLDLLENLNAQLEVSVTRIKGRHQGKEKDYSISREGKRGG